MSKVITESKEIFGELFTKFGTFKMLERFPSKTQIPWYLKETMFSCYIMDRDGFAKYILVGGDGWIIKPLSEKVFLDVRFLLEEGDEVTEAEYNKPIFPEEV